MTMSRFLPYVRLSFLAFVAACLPIASTLALPPEGEGSSLTVPDASICTEVRDREPVGAGTRFPASVGRLFCFTRVAGAIEPTHVTHVWYHGEREVHSIDLQVGGPSWRTWSYKTIPSDWTGAWRVDVKDANGVIIYSLPFTVSDEPGEQPAAPGGRGR
jgi:hypothetical protein